MPVFAFGGAINSNSPQQNAVGVTIGQYHSSGWDANMKLNISEGGLYGIFNGQFGSISVTYDNFEVVDAVVNDQDQKPMVGGNG
ncbi:hypothetical protein [Alicyclobacillus mengziensis]|uniref:Uncharacterized protein n=1 Tax=Alicyclobacillus mengziensis TaxID=2931921 RepID=A0A9X7VWG2_9BACL|nr:hypothetical protein [Alicyclobacillus mengziensis]QSO46299.1 hypothetical protein JZ786_17605 [Alicyclobacillus mengziensis]